MDWIKVDKIPVIKSNDKVEFDFEKICTNRDSFELFKNYLTSAYNYCLETNPFSVHTFESINKINNRASFQQFIGLVDSGTHEKILKKALEKEWNMNVDFSTPGKYRELEGELSEISELPILDSSDLKFGFSNNKELTSNTKKAFVQYKLVQFRKSELASNKGLNLK